MRKYKQMKQRKLPHAVTNLKVRTPILKDFC